MKHVLRPSCGCASRTPLPIQPERRPPEEPACRPPEPAVCPPPNICPGGYLMQRILAVGRAHRRRFCQPVCLSSLPEQAVPPYTVLDVCACAVSQWEEIPCRRRGCVVFRVTVPLRVRVRDGCGSVYTVSSEWEEELPLRFEYPQAECWIGQPCFQAAVRLAGRPCPCDSRCCEVPLEAMVEGYLLSPCAWGQGNRPACPPDRPWYPQPICDPYPCR